MISRKGPAPAFSGGFCFLEKMDRDASELHRARTIWNRQDTRRARTGAGGLPEGVQSSLHDGGGLVHELMEARDERRLRALQKHLNTVKLLIVDELGYVPFTAVGSELLFDVFSQRYEHGSTLVTSKKAQHRQSHAPNASVKTISQGDVDP